MKLQVYAFSYIVKECVRLHIFMYLHFMHFTGISARVKKRTVSKREINLRKDIYNVCRSSDESKRIQDKEIDDE